MKSIIIFILSLSCSVLLAQNTDKTSDKTSEKEAKSNNAQSINNNLLRAELSYPFTIGDQFITEYTEWGDLGLSYSPLRLENFEFGVKLNSSFFQKSEIITFRESVDDPGIRADVKMNITLLQPRIFTRFSRGKNFSAEIGLGLTYLHSNTVLPDNVSNSFGIESTSENGFSSYISIQHKISNSFFCFLTYDITFLEDTQYFNETISRNINLLKIGIGYQFLRK